MNFRSCKHATRLISDAEERRLTFREWLRMKIHLSICPPCQRYNKHLRFLHRVTRKADEELPVKSPLRGEAKEKIKRELDMRREDD